MEIALAVLTIAGAVMLGAMSPGPSFLMAALGIKLLVEARRL